MRNNLFEIFLLGLIIFTTACNTQKKTATVQGTAQSAGKNVSYVRMERTPCFGRCASYAVEVNKDGMVTYTGILFVKDSGVYQKNIGTAKAEELLSKFNAYRVDTVQNDYDVRTSDIPGINYSFGFGEQSIKKVRNAHFGPAFLKELAREVDMLVKKNDEFVIDNSWKKVSSSPKGD